MLQIRSLFKVGIQKGAEMRCLLINLTAQILANICTILAVSVLKDNPKWTSLALSAQQVLIGIVLSGIAARYWGVNKGNTYIMNNKKLPPEHNK